MKERIFLLLLVLCHLVVTEEASAKEEKVDGEKDQGGGGNSVTMDHDKKGRMANKESEKSEKSESETRGPPRLRKAMEVVVGKVGKFCLFDFIFFYYENWWSSRWATFDFWDIYIYVQVIMGGLQGGQGGQDGLPHHRQPHPHHRMGEGEIQKVKIQKLCNTCLGRMVRW